MIKREFLAWTFIGLLIRFLIMPFSFHGHDIFFIYYPPFKFITEGIWDPYLFLKGSYPQVQNPYFPPAIFFIISAFLFLFKPFLPNLYNLFSTFESWNFTWEGNTIHYADILMGHQLFRTLFIFKIPYLIFDFGSAWFLLQILKPDEKKRLFAYKLWMLNPFVLHSCYALGSLHIINAFFVMAAIYCVYSNRRYSAMWFLSLAIASTTFPMILAPFAILLLGRNFKDMLKLSFVIVIPIIAITIPFYLSSHNAIFEAVLFSSGGIPLFKQVSFIGGYLAILCLFFFSQKRKDIDLDLIVLSFVLALSLFYAFYTVTIRYFILMTPLLIYIALKDKRFWLYNIIFLISLFGLRTAGNTQQWGLFAAFHPTFFSGLPILDSYINLAFNVKYIHQALYRVFFISSLAMAVHILLINKNLFGIRFSRLKR